MPGHQDRLLPGLRERPRVVISGPHLAVKRYMRYVWYIYIYVCVEYVCCTLTATIVVSCKWWELPIQHPLQGKTGTLPFTPWSCSMLLSQKLHFLTLHGQKGMTVAYLFIIMAIVAIVAIGEVWKRRAGHHWTLTCSIHQYPGYTKSWQEPDFFANDPKCPQKASWCFSDSKMGVAIDSSI